MDARQQRLLSAVGSGLIGAAVLTAIHQVARELVPGAPRMDVLGRRAIAMGLRSLGVRPPRTSMLQRYALAGDIVSNTAYYALVGVGGGRTLRKGTLLGVLAGIGAVVLPPLMGLGRRPSRATDATKAMTIAWYTAGGIAAGAAYRGLARPAWG